jgi:hypothetical protein
MPAPAAARTRPARGLLAIAGHPRSGTTLLMDLCNTHPELAVARELGVFTAINRPLREWVRALNYWQLRKASVGPKKRDFPYAANAAFYVRAVGATALSARGGRVRSQAIERGLRAAMPGAKIVGDKRPSYVFGLRRFRSNGIPAVIIYRDGRDALASLRTTGARGVAWAARMARRPLGIQAARWVHAVEAMEAASDWAHCVRYEALIESPEPCLGAMADYLGISPSGFDVSSIESGNSGKWRSVFSSGEIAEIEHAIGPTLRRLGYA